MHFRTFAIVLAGLSIAMGGLGMPLSAIFLASRTLIEVTAGAAGLVAGSVLIGAGVISLAILNAKGSDPVRE